MSEEIVLRKSQTSPRSYRLCKRSSDLSGTNYQDILRITLDQAAQIAAAHPEITGHNFPREAAGGDGLVIERVRNRAPNTRSWQLRLNGKIMTREVGGMTFVLRISNNHARWLQELTQARFECGEPDWNRQTLEMAEDEKHDLKERLSRLGTRIAHIKQNCASERTSAEPIELELFFKKIDGQAFGDAMAFLKTPGMPADGQVVLKPSDHTHLVRGVMGASNRSREILVTDTRETAEIATALRGVDGNCSAHIQEISPNLWCASIVHLDGQYNDGLPTIIDLRRLSAPFEIAGEIRNFLEIATPFFTAPDDAVIAFEVEP